MSRGIPDDDPLSGAVAGASTAATNAIRGRPEPQRRGAIWLTLRFVDSDRPLKPTSGTARKHSLPGGAHMSVRRHEDEPTCPVVEVQNGDGSGSGGSGGGGLRSAQGREVLVTPEGVVTCRVPSGSMAKIQPLANVLSRWWVRHRQQRL